jgi:5'-phosphate synthase pdxT subunit
MSAWRSADGDAVIGVLALQGDSEAHLGVLAAAGVAARPVKSLEDLRGVDGLVFPGGESTAQALLLEASGLRKPLEAALAEGMPAFGTCAGLILLARSIEGGRDDQWSFGVVNVTVRRNGFGRQVCSFETDLAVAGVAGPPMHATFIRAPVITAVGSDVEVLAEVTYRFEEGETTVPVVVRQGSVVATSFHPELAGDARLHQLAFPRAGTRTSDGS